MTEKKTAVIVYVRRNKDGEPRLEVFFRLKDAQDIRRRDITDWGFSISTGVGGKKGAIATATITMMTVVRDSDGIDHISIADAVKKKRTLRKAVGEVHKALTRWFADRGYVPEFRRLAYPRA